MHESKKKKKEAAKLCIPLHCGGSTNWKGNFEISSDFQRICIVKYRMILKTANIIQVTFIALQETGTLPRKKKTSQPVIKAHHGMRSTLSRSDHLQTFSLNFLFRTTAIAHWIQSAYAIHSLSFRRFSLLPPKSQLVWTIYWRMLTCAFYGYVLNYLRYFGSRQRQTNDNTTGVLAT